MNDTNFEVGTTDKLSDRINNLQGNVDAMVAQRNTILEALQPICKGCIRRQDCYANTFSRYQFAPDGCANHKLMRM